MTTRPRLYVAVTGTCTAKPGEDLYAKLAKIREGTLQRYKVDFFGYSRDVTGGSTVTISFCEEGIGVIDTGDVDDRPTLEQSLNMIDELESTGIRDSGIHKILAFTHTDYDHMGNLDLFPSSARLVSEHDDYLRSVLPDRKGNYKNERFPHRRKLYAGLVKGEINSDMFRYVSHTLIGAVLPGGPHVIHTPGHLQGHVSFMYDDTDINLLEDGCQIQGVRAIITGDAIVSRDYLERFFYAGREQRMHAVYGVNIPPENHKYKYPKDRNSMDYLAFESIRKLLLLALEPAALARTIMVFGHDRALEFGKFARHMGITQRQVTAVENPFGK